MATTKIFPIKVSVSDALAYIANPEKTDNGRLIFTSGCSYNPRQASRDFEAIRAKGTGLNTVLAQHFTMSFKPGEIMPERALEIGKELCQKYLKGEYQYYLAVHTDKDHIHVHCIFNNVSMWNGRTFETNENRRFTEKDRSYYKLRTLADEVEFQMTQQGIEPDRREADTGNTWIVLDYEDIIVHVFYKDTRQFYKLESNWADGEQIDISEYLVKE